MLQGSGSVQVTDGSPMLGRAGPKTVKNQTKREKGHQKTSQKRPKTSKKLDHVGVLRAINDLI